MSAAGAVVASASFDLGGPNPAKADALGYAYGAVTQSNAVLAPHTVYVVAQQFRNFLPLEVPRALCILKCVDLDLHA
jgi:hypothetical protein